jgi:hypothetical protein
MPFVRLLPITRHARDFKIANGLGALESIFKSER